MTPSKVNFKIYQGSTFNEVLRWESLTKKYIPIVAAFKAAPLVINAVAHNMNAGWRAKITNAQGMTELNSLGYITATATTADTVTFNSVNAAGFKEYTTGGILEYNEPMSLTGVTARMQIRAKVTSTEIIDELTTENGMILVDNTLKKITILISAADTAAYTFKSAVYSLELISGTTVTPFIYGNLTLDNEVTR